MNKYQSKTPLPQYRQRQGHFSLNKNETKKKNPKNITLSDENTNYNLHVLESYRYRKFLDLEGFANV